MLGELVEPITTIKEEQLKKFAYLITLTTLMVLLGKKERLRLRAVNMNSILIYFHNHNAPCAICYVPTRATTIMVPAKTACPSSWIREYYGYLTTESSSDHRSLYTCIDINLEVIAGTSANTNPARIFLASTDCSDLLCPPYENNRVLSCAVCTK